MKTFTLSICLVCFLFTFVKAQDKILLKNGESIEAKVLEVGKDMVRYKKWSNLEGPEYILNNADVFFVRLGSGNKIIPGENTYPNQPREIVEQSKNNPEPSLNYGDVIYIKEGEDIRCKVEEILGGYVFYRLPENVQLQKVSEERIIFVAYSDGRKYVPNKQAIINTTKVKELADDVFTSGTFISFGISYGFPTSSGNRTDFFNTSRSGNVITYERKNVSLGDGLNAEATIGYRFNDNIGTQLCLSYFFGSKDRAHQENFDGATDYTISSNMFFFKPSVVIVSGLSKFNPYSRFGLAFGKGAITYEIRDEDRGDVAIVKTKFSGGLSIGWDAAVGINLFKGQGSGFYSELILVSMSYAPTKGEVTEATYNGADFLPDLTTSEREVELVKSYKYNYQNPPSDSQPTQLLKEKFAFGSLGIKVGYKICF